MVMQEGQIITGIVRKMERKADNKFKSRYVRNASQVQVTTSNSTGWHDIKPIHPSQ